ncbi:MAG: type IV-A pilus assembly ATPase PilB [Gemmatimonadota bacterium]|nr:MAG: type IV-A pilus assembly ATPase PilB [Gemmatimonadota bacterium]
MANDRLETLLLENEVITSAQLEQVKNQQKSSGDPLDTCLVKLGVMSEGDLLTVLSRIYDMPAVDLLSFDVDKASVDLLPADVATKSFAIPIRKVGRTLTLAMADPLNLYAIDDIKFIVGLEVQPVVAAESAIKKTIDRFYGTANALNDIMKDMEDGAGVEVVEDADEDDAFGGENDAPVIKYVNSLLAEAVTRRASDIHIEPFEKHIRVRLRQDGALYELPSPPLRMKAPITSRLKLMAELDIAEKRVPQDGRIKILIQNRKIDLRVSTLPVIYGEKIVMRILDQSNLNVNLETFGFQPEALSRFMHAIASPYGMVLVTGPTGSGKTTTLYSAISKINKVDTNIMTAEDPVEYNLAGINQVNVNEAIGLSFAAALKSFLRQDPNIIMVGEIRDLETGAIAVKAALTGHLVLSTLHTNDAPSSVDRLIDMGVAPFLVSSSVNCIVAQRLLRRVCQNCREETEPHEELLKELQLEPERLNGSKIYKAVGCNDCHSTGYKGRTGIYEVFRLSSGVRKMILDRCSTAELKKAAVEEGMLTLRQDSLRKMLLGDTTPEEVLRETAAD